MKFRALASLIGLVLTSGSAVAQSFFLPAHDARLRDDLSLLVDEGVLNLPVNEWPLARGDVAEALGRVAAEDLHELALRAALHRVLAATTNPEDVSEWRLRELEVTAGEPGLLRDDSTLGRERFALTSVGGAATGRYGIRVAATGVVDASDGKRLRLDGTEITVRWGNWLLGANQMDRWWGPGRDGSLILSSNARPMPALSLDRYRSLPVDLPVLRWLGPWRFSAFIGLMESHRPDVDRPLFMGMRLSFKPAPVFEFGLSRTAQFCGEQRPCGVRTFGRVLIGRDNPGYRGLDDPAKEPGNQMAGLDVRIVSPVRAIPVAVHAQLIGEDNSSSGIPERYLAQFGAEGWALLPSGSVLRGHVEYANNSCKWYSAWMEPNCAYRQGIFFAGYRYRGRNIGHTTDSDSETTSVMLSLTESEGDKWVLRARRGRLDPYGAPDTFNLVSLGRSRIKSVDVAWSGTARRQQIAAQVGYEHQSPSSAGKARGIYGFVRWHKSL